MTSRDPSAKPVAGKLSLKEGLRAFFQNVPEALDAPLRAGGIEVAARFEGAFDRILCFARTQAEMEREFPRLKKRLAPGGVLWLAWPKAKKLGTDLNIREVIRIGYDHGLVESTNLSVDETWTALKFTWPKPGKAYANRYGKLPD